MYSKLFDVNTFQRSNNRYNRCTINIYADELLKPFKFEIVLYNKVVDFEILGDFYIEHAF